MAELHRVAVPRRGRLAAVRTMVTIAPRQDYPANTPVAYTFTWQKANGFTFLLDLAVMLTAQV